MLFRNFSHFLADFSKPSEPSENSQPTRFFREKWVDHRIHVVLHGDSIGESSEDERTMLRAKQQLLCSVSLFFIKEAVVVRARLKILRSFLNIFISASACTSLSHFLILGTPTSLVINSGEHFYGITYRTTILLNSTKSRRKCRIWLLTREGTAYEAGSALFYPKGGGRCSLFSYGREA